MIKNITKEIQGIKFEGTNPLAIIESVSDEQLNRVCFHITGIEGDYAEDVFAPGMGVDIISDFLLSITDKYKKSPNFKKLITTYLSPLMQKLNPTMKASSSQVLNQR